MTILTGYEGLAYPQVLPSPGLFVKYPPEIFDVIIDWAGDGFLPDNDVIATSTWVADEGITMTADSATDTTTTVWVSGGTAGWLYHVTNTITTSGGRTFYRILYFKVKHTPDDWATP